MIFHPASRRWLLGCAFVMLSAGCKGDNGGALDEEIDAVFRAAHERGTFSGSVLVTRGERTIYERSFGLADREMPIPNTADTKFAVFSIVKPLTAMLVFQQIGAGRLRLVDTLDTVFPNLAGKPAGRISLQQLLTHTSGIQEVISDHLDRRLTAHDLEIAAVPTGASFKYSSTGYVCLALVLEAVTGRSYEDLLQEGILIPAGMRDSGVLRTGRIIPGLARGYRPVDGKLTATEFGVVVEALDGAGSLYTTARDLWRLDRALRAEKILSRRPQDEMLSQQIEGRFGYGWFLDEQGGRYFPWHKGDFRGHAAVWVRQVHRDETIVILANQEEADVLGLRSKLLRLLKAHPHL